MITLKTQEEKELWKQVVLAYINGRNGNVVNSDAVIAADRTIEQLRDRDYSENKV